MYSIITSNYMSGISVIIPVYNREKFLKEAIQSVLDQKLIGTLEIIVSDDGSTDKSLEIADSFGSLVKVLRKPNDCLSQGVSGARNRGIQMATQPYICFLDSDDFYLPGHLNQMIALMETRQDISFAFSRMQEMKEIDGVRYYTPWTRPVVIKRDICYLGLTRPKLVHMNVLITRIKALQQIGMFDESYSNGEDGDLWIRLSEKHSGEFLDYFGAVYRIEHGYGQLCDNSMAVINRCAFQVFSSALKRHLKQIDCDPYRLFLIRQKILGILFSNEFPWRYRINLLGLFMRNPICFVNFIADSLKTYRSI